jgi:hypothetical protein
MKRVFIEAPLRLDNDTILALRHKVVVWICLWAEIVLFGEVLCFFNGSD